MTGLSVTALSNGKAVIVYAQDEDGGKTSIRYLVRGITGGNDGDPGILVPAWSNANDVIPVVAAVAGGYYAVVYNDSSVEGDGLSLVIASSSELDPRTIGPVRVDTDFAAIEHDAAITALSNGLILVIPAALSVDSIVI